MDAHSHVLCNFLPFWGGIWLLERYNGVKSGLEHSSSFLAVRRFFFPVPNPSRGDPVVIFSRFSVYHGAFFAGWESDDHRQSFFALGDDADIATNRVVARSNFPLGLLSVLPAAANGIAKYIEWRDGPFFRVRRHGHATRARPFPSTAKVLRTDILSTSLIPPTSVCIGANVSPAHSPLDHCLAQSQRHPPVPEASHCASAPPTTPQSLPGMSSISPLDPSIFRVPFISGSIPPTPRVPKREDVGRGAGNDLPERECRRDVSGSAERHSALRFAGLTTASSPSARPSTYGQCYINSRLFAQFPPRSLHTHFITSTLSTIHPPQTTTTMLCSTRAIIPPNGFVPYGGRSVAQPAPSSSSPSSPNPARRRSSVPVRRTPKAEPLRLRRQPARQGNPPPHAALVKPEAPGGVPMSRQRAHRGISSESYDSAVQAKVLPMGGVPMCRQRAHRGSDSSSGYADDAMGGVPMRRGC
ncbi:hypothetical protein C8F01DRAFT_1084298 [Mycena amicta]|nr:hypothetical protein C8F01DRAFT_1084298 [Mycena amicta]